MDGNTRRLPPWMIAGASSGVTATSNRRDEGGIKQEAEAPKDKKKRKIKRDRDDEDVEETKKVEIRRRGGGVRRKIKEEEEAKPNIDDDKGREINQSVPCPEDEEDLTVDDLLSFAQEYVKCEDEDRAKEITLADVNDESTNMRSSEGDQTSEDMLSLLLGPFFKKSGTN